MTDMRRNLFIVLTLFGCGESRPEILLIVDGAPSVAAVAKEARVKILDGEVVVDTYQTLLTGAAPACLPFSLGLVPAEDTATDAALGVLVELDRIDGEVIRWRVDSRFLPGARELSIAIPAQCATQADCQPEPISVPEPPEVDKVGAMARITERACAPRYSPVECATARGCYASADVGAPICLIPCPANSLVAPPAAPDPPIPPDAPVLLPCPPNWIEQDNGDDPTTCIPWAIDAPECALGEARFPGDPVCRRLGAECPLAELPDPLPVGAIVVRAGIGADLAAVVAGAPSGASIVLGKGVHTTAPVVVTRPVTIQGSCATETFVDAVGAIAFTIDADAALLELTIRGGVGGARIDAGQVTLARAQVVGGTGPSVEVRGGRLEATELSIRDAMGVGLEIAGAFVARGLEIDGAASAGARWAGGSGDLEDVVVRDVTNGSGLDLGGGANVVMERALIERTAAPIGVVDGSTLGASILVLRERGLLLDHAAVAELDHVFVSRYAGRALDVRDRSRARATDLFALGADLGDGVSCTGDGQAQLDRIALDRPRLVGINTDRCRLSVTDLGVRRPDPRGDDGGAGVWLRMGRHRIVRARVTDPHETAFVFDRGARVSGSDLEATTTESGRGNGRGLHLRGSVGVTVDRVQADGSDIGVTVTAESSTGATTLSNLTLRNLRGSVLFVTANAAAGASVTVRRAHFSDSVGSVVLTDDPAPTVAPTGTSVELEDVTIRHIGFDGPMATGPSMYLGTASRVVAHRLMVEDADDAAVVTDNTPGGSAFLEDFTAVRSTCRPAPRGGCGLYAGTGLATTFNSKATLRRFSLRDQQLNGLRHIDGDLSLEDGEIVGNPVGILSWYTGEQLQRLMVGVHFRDNGQNFSELAR